MAFIKICGMTDTRAVAAALEAGVDAIGFVFAPSVRQVTPAQAVELARPARGRVLCVAVTQHPGSEMLEEIFHIFRPDVWQTDRQDLQRHEAPNGMLVWPVLRGAPSSRVSDDLQGRRILFEGPKSGTGKVADWTAARTLATRSELILAGGLSPANVGEAIAAVRPFGVDVSSGVEEAPGRKSPALIEDFVVRARGAFARAGMGELT
ncbi:MAG: phosphoribosylanthranilate isomerase [Pseudomonadota bacterium]|nr:phosphoribosylanthranilate isomerase [Pseudomonadota bacterium]